MRVTNLGHYLKDNEKSQEGFEQGTDIIRLALEKDTRVTSVLLLGCRSARWKIMWQGNIPTKHLLSTYGLPCIVSSPSHTRTACGC